MDFQSNIKELLHLAEGIHRLNNSMSSLLFANEKGWIDEKERGDLEKLNKEYTDIRQRADLLWKKLSTKYSSDFQEYLHSFREQLKKQEEKIHTPSFSQNPPRGEFNSSIINTLINVFTALIQGEKPGRDPYWAVAVGNQILIHKQGDWADSGNTGNT